MFLEREEDALEPHKSRIYTRAAVYIYVYTQKSVVILSQAVIDLLSADLRREHMATFQIIVRT